MLAAALAIMACVMVFSTQAERDAAMAEAREDTAPLMVPPTPAKSTLFAMRGSEDMSRALRLKRYREQLASEDGALEQDADAVKATLTQELQGNPGAPAVKPAATEKEPAKEKKTITKPAEAAAATKSRQPDQPKNADLAPSLKAALERANAALAHEKAAVSTYKKWEAKLSDFPAKILTKKKIAAVHDGIAASAAKDIATQKKRLDDAQQKTRLLKQKTFAKLKQAAANKEAANAVLRRAASVVHTESPAVEETPQKAAEVAEAAKSEKVEILASRLKGVVDSLEKLTEETEAEPQGSAVKTWLSQAPKAALEELVSMQSVRTKPADKLSPSGHDAAVEQAEADPILRGILEEESSAAAPDPKASTPMLDRLKSSVAALDDEMRHIVSKEDPPDATAAHVQAHAAKKIASLDRAYKTVGDSTKEVPPAVHAHLKRVQAHLMMMKKQVQDKAARDVAQKKLKLAQKQMKADAAALKEAEAANAKANELVNKDHAALVVKAAVEVPDTADEAADQVAKEAVRNFRIMPGPVIPGLASGLASSRNKTEKGKREGKAAPWEDGVIQKANDAKKAEEKATKDNADKDITLNEPSPTAKEKTAAAVKEEEKEKHEVDELRKWTDNQHKAELKQVAKEAKAAKVADDVAAAKKKKAEDKVAQAKAKEEEKKKKQAAATKKAVKAGVKTQEAADAAVKKAQKALETAQKEASQIAGKAEHEKKEAEKKKEVMKKKAEEKKAAEKASKSSSEDKSKHGVKFRPEGVKDPSKVTKTKATKASKDTESEPHTVQSMADKQIDREKEAEENAKKLLKTADELGKQEKQADKEATDEAKEESKAEEDADKATKATEDTNAKPMTAVETSKAEHHEKKKELHRRWDRPRYEDRHPFEQADDDEWHRLSLRNRPSRQERRFQRAEMMQGGLTQRTKRRHERRSHTDHELDRRHASRRERRSEQRSERRHHRTRRHAFVDDRAHPFSVFRPRLSRLHGDDDDDDVMLADPHNHETVDEGATRLREALEKENAMKEAKAAAMQKAADDSKAKEAAKEKRREEEADRKAEKAKRDEANAQAKADRKAIQAGQDMANAAAAKAKAAAKELEKDEVDKEEAEAKAVRNETKREEKEPVHSSLLASALRRAHKPHRQQREPHALRLIEADEARILAKEAERINAEAQRPLAERLAAANAQLEEQQHVNLIQQKDLAFKHTFRERRLEHDDQLDTELAQAASQERRLAVKWVALLEEQKRVAARKAAIVQRKAQREAKRLVAKKVQDEISLLEADTAAKASKEVGSKHREQRRRIALIQADTVKKASLGAAHKIEKRAFHPLSQIAAPSRKVTSNKANKAHKEHAHRVQSLASKVREVAFLEEPTQSAEEDLEQLVAGLGILSGANNAAGEAQEKELESEILDQLTTDLG